MVTGKDEVKSAWKEKLNKVGLKVTGGRLGVLRVLEQLSGPVVVAEIECELERIKVRVDQVTVYRVLEKLTAKGIVERVEFGDGQRRYELQKRHHHHLVCEKCGRVEPIYEETLQLDEEKVRREKQFLIRRHSLEFFGECGKCRDMER